MPATLVRRGGNGTRWSIRWRHLGKQCQIPAFKQLAATNALRDRVSELLENANEQLPASDSLTKWIRDLDPSRRDKLAAYALIPRSGDLGLRSK